MNLPSTAGTVFATYAQRGFGTLMAFATTVLIARSLGPDGRGMVASIMAVAAIAAQLSNLGFQSANTYFVAQDATFASTAKAQSLLVGFGVGGVTVLVLLALNGVGLLLPTLDLRLVAIGVLVVPFTVSTSLFQGLLIGLGRLGAFNVSELLQKGVALAIVLALVLGGAATPTSVIGATTLVQVAVFSMLLFAVRDITLTARTASSLSALGPQLRYGLRAFMASLLAFLLLRVDLIMVQQMAGNEAAGHYSVAMAFFDGVYLLPATIGLILFPKLSAMSEFRSRWRETTSVMWLTLWLLLLIGVLLGFGAEPIISRLFGTEFAPSASLLHVLLLAVLFYGLNAIVSVFLASCGMPWVGVYAWIPALVVNVLLNLAWIPEFGAMGAAWSSVIGYLLVLVFQLVYCVRRT